MKNNNIPIITIDGPSSSGKGTIGKLLAEKIGWNYLDSGAVYRAMALLIIENNIESNNVDKIICFIKNLNPTQIKIKLQNQIEIRSEECGIIASKIATIPEVRFAINLFLKKFNVMPGLIADGRDMGTVVFPKACLKLFLIANNEERAARRFLQLQQNGKDVSFNVVLQDLIERDTRDQNRKESPLKPDPAAIMIDTTKLSVDEVLQLILQYVDLL